MNIYRLIPLIVSLFLCLCSFSVQGQNKNIVPIISLLFSYPTNEEALISYVRSLVVPVDASRSIILSRSGENYTSVYKNSLGIMSLLYSGHKIDAEKVLNVFKVYFENQGMDFDGFPQDWDGTTATPFPDAGEYINPHWVGDNSFLLLALNYYHTTNNGYGVYGELANGLKDWLILKAATCTTIVAEGTANMYAALSGFSGNDVPNQTLLDLKDCFDSDYDTENVLDHIVRGTLVFGDTSGFGNIDNFSKTEIWQKNNITEIQAYSESPNGYINVEISAQILLTWLIWNDNLLVNLSSLQKQLEKLFIYNGSERKGLPYRVREIPDDFYLSYSIPIIDPSCFLLFYYWGFNPFAPGETHAGP